MWIGRGHENQWPSSEFHEHIRSNLEEDAEFIPFGMTDDEVIDSYLLVLLGIAAPAGKA